jgi:hypothetical protein
LIDWSGDGSHALLSIHGPSGQPPATILVDLHTGTQTTISAGASGFTRPEGHRPRSLPAPPASHAPTARPSWCQPTTTALSRGR